MKKNNNSHTLIQAGKNAQQFLIGQRQPNGLWEDFKTLAGKSNEWLSGYVGSVLALHGNEEARMVAEEVCKKLFVKHFWQSGWSYSHIVPPDADSTTWVIRLAQSVNINKHGRLERAEKFLLKHIDDNGGIHTYYNSNAIRIFTKLSKSEVSFEGWCSAHTCVTAAFAHLKNDSKTKALEYLRKNQEPEGYWKAYWWTDNEYSTALATEALFATEQSADKLLCEKAIQWAETLELFRSPFVAALIVRILLCTTNPNLPLINQILGYLLKEQLDDGSWKASAYLRIPPTYVTNPETYKTWQENAGGGGSYQRDYGRLFTTATVLAAIQTYLKRFPEVE